jgi:hypothetical protein
MAGPASITRNSSAATRRARLGRLSPSCSHRSQRASSCATARAATLRGEPMLLLMGLASSADLVGPGFLLDARPRRLLVVTPDNRDVGARPRCRSG